MIIKIKKQEETKEISISCGSIKPIIAANDSDTWNTTEINNFLIKIASNNPESEVLLVTPKSNELNKDDVEMTFIVRLFEDFAEEYNKKMKELLGIDTNDVN